MESCLAQTGLLLVAAIVAKFNRPAVAGASFGPPPGSVQLQSGQKVPVSPFYPLWQMAFPGIALAETISAGQPRPEFSLSQSLFFKEYSQLTLFSNSPVEPFLVPPS